MGKNFKLSSRRSFIQQTALGGAGMMLVNPAKLFSQEKVLSPLVKSEGNSVLDIENLCTVTSTVYAWLRNDTSFETGFTYWRDIHGTLVARIPGKFIYRQLHLKPAINVLSGQFQKYVNPVVQALQPQGIAHTYYLNEYELAKFKGHQFTQTYLIEDEPNMARLNASLWSHNDNAKTLKDISNNLMPQGKTENDEYVVSFIFEKQVSIDDRREKLIKLSESLITKHEVTRLRYHVLEDYDDENVPDTKVGHCRPTDVRYNAWLELGVLPKSELSQLIEKDLLPLATDVKTIHINPIFERYTVVAEGKPTIVGLKGFPAYQTILRAGAANQLDENLLEDLYGKFPKE